MHDGHRRIGHAAPTCLVRVALDARSSRSPGSGGDATTWRSAATSTRSCRWTELGLPFDAVGRRRSNACSTPAWRSWTRSTSRRTRASRRRRDRRLPPRLPRRPRLGRARLAARDGDPSRLVRPLALRHRDVGADGPAARARRAGARRGLRQRVVHRQPVRRARWSTTTSVGGPCRRSSRPSPDAPGSPARPSTCSIRTTRSRPDSCCEPARRQRSRQPARAGGHGVARRTRVGAVEAGRRLLGSGPGGPVRRVGDARARGDARPRQGGSGRGRPEQGLPGHRPRRPRSRRADRDPRTTRDPDGGRSRRATVLSGHFLVAACRTAGREVRGNRRSDRLRRGRP